MGATILTINIPGLAALLTRGARNASAQHELIYRRMNKLGRRRGVVKAS